LATNLQRNFAAVNTPENLSNYIAQSFNTQQTEELTNPESSFT
jgi:hypothetical protein